ncbi:MAG: PKD domain-containing protein [Cyanobacteria bacterium]|nr:PKD domain-containing protein [Cyanobacteriota bacterium]
MNIIYKNSFLENIFYDSASDLKIIPLETNEQISTVIIHANIDSNSDLDFQITANQISPNSKLFEFGVSVDSSLVKQYYWDFGDGLGSQEANPIGNFSSISGPVQVKLNIIDSNNLLATRTLGINVPNDPPFVEFSYSPTEPAENESINFSSSAVDNDGQIQSRSWDWGDGATNSLGTNPSHQYSQCGNYTITHTAIDDLGAQTSKTKSIFIEGPTCNKDWYLTSLDEFYANINNSDFPGYFNLLPYYFVVYNQHTDDPNVNRSEISNYEWDMDGDGDYEYSSNIYYYQERTYANPSSNIVRVKIQTTDGKISILEKSFDIDSVFNPTPSGANVSSGTGTNQIVQLDQKKATKVAIDLANNSPYNLSFGIEAAEDSQRLIKFTKKKNKTKLDIAGQNSSNFKFQIAPISKLSKQLSLDSNGNYILNLNVFGLSFNADKEQKYQLRIEAQP